MTKQTNSRPLSPHLQVYKPQITSVMSILHRITGVGLSFGLLLFLWFVMALANGPEAYDYFVWFTGSIIGHIVIFGFIIALSYHLSNGVRHLLWDMGRGYDIQFVTKSGQIVLGSTVIIALFVLIAILF